MSAPGRRTLGPASLRMPRRVVPAGVRDISSTSSARITTLPQRTGRGPPARVGGSSHHRTRLRPAAAFAPPVLALLSHGIDASRRRQTGMQVTLGSAPATRERSLHVRRSGVHEGFAELAQPRTVAARLGFDPRVCARSPAVPCTLLRPASGVFDAVASAFFAGFGVAARQFRRASRRLRSRRHRALLSTVRLKSATARRRRCGRVVRGDGQGWSPSGLVAEPATGAADPNAPVPHRRPGGRPHRPGCGPPPVCRVDAARSPRPCSPKSIPGADAGPPRRRGTTDGVPAPTGGHGTHCVRQCRSLKRR